MRRKERLVSQMFLGGGGGGGGGEKNVWEGGRDNREGGRSKLTTNKA